MASDPETCEWGSAKRAAAIANRFMGLANNGGLNSFLTASPDLDAWEVVTSLETLGASKAAALLTKVLDGIGVELPAMSSKQRWELLDEHWGEKLDACDGLDAQADDELSAALEKHVADNAAYYLSFDS